MKTLQKAAILLLIYINYFPEARGDQQQVMDQFSDMVSKCDIGYKVTFEDHDSFPFRIDILIISKNGEKAIRSFRTAPLENINENLAKDSRVYFVWRSEDNDKSEMWSFAEKDGKIRIHDRKAKKGYWVDLGAFLKRVEEKSKGDKKILFNR